MLKFNETSPALTAKQIKVERMITQSARIQARMDEMNKDVTNRLDWTIEQKANWIATYNPTGKILVARTKSQLMSKINTFEKEL